MSLEKHLELGVVIGNLTACFKQTPRVCNPVIRLSVGWKKIWRIHRLAFMSLVFARWLVMNWWAAPTWKLSTGTGVMLLLASSSAHATTGAKAMVPMQ